MGRNRFLSTKLDVNCFRSNLLLLINNLHIEGLPMSKLGTEYKKYFHEEVNPESLAKSLGLDLIAIAAKQNQKNTTTMEIWSRIFSTPILYEFFTLEELPTNNKDPENTKENFIKCRRGRTVAEMHVLAQLASFRNIEYIRSNGKGKLVEGVDLAVMGLCDDVHSSFDSSNTNSEDVPVPSSEVRVLKESNPLKRKLDFGHDETTDGSENETISTKISARSLSPPLPLRVQDTPITNTNTKAVLVLVRHTPDPINTMDDLDGGRAGSSEAEETVVSDQRKPTTVSVPKSSGEPLGGEDNQASTDTNERLATIILRNHKGETKIVQYVKVQHKCRKCNQSFENEVFLSRHRKQCVANPQKKVQTCGGTTPTVLNFKAHEPVCDSANIQDNVEQEMDSNQEETVSQISDLIHLEEEAPIITDESHIALNRIDGAVYTRTRSSQSKYRN